MHQEEIIIAPLVDIDRYADGLSDSSWTAAQPVHLTRFWSGHEAPVSSHAEACVVWTQHTLSVRFICNQRHPLVVSSHPRLDQKTLGLWDRDVCEIFMAPFPDQPSRYFEFEAAPTGEWVDLAVSFKEGHRINDFNFMSGMTVRPKVSADQVEIVMTIPWTTSIPRPQKGDEWRANLFRCVGLGNERYLAWHPTFSLEPNFHVPEAFGILRFT